MEATSEQKLHTGDHDEPEIEKISQDFTTQMKLSDQDSQDFHEDREEEDNENEEKEDEDDDDDDFSFMWEGADASSLAADDAFIDGQMKPIFPLFNRELFFSNEEYSMSSLHDNLAIRPPVNKIFVETNGAETSTTSENDEISGPYCEWSSRKAIEATSEPCKKSNSTGFSKIWRFKDLKGRSNSDGRDAYVFLSSGSHAPPPTTEESKIKVVRKKANNSNGKGKKAPLSAHEVYLKSKAKGDEKRRSYLPYRPELMGFFTNANVGFTKNVHPY